MFLRFHYCGHHLLPKAFPWGILLGGPPGRVDILQWLLFHVCLLVGRLLSGPGLTWMYVARGLDSMG